MAAALAGGTGRFEADALTEKGRAGRDRPQCPGAVGFQIYLVKPVEPAELIVTVATLAKLNG